MKYLLFYFCKHFNTIFHLICKLQIQKITKCFSVGTITKLFLYIYIFIVLNTYFIISKKITLNFYFAVKSFAMFSKILYRYSLLLVNL